MASSRLAAWRWAPSSGAKRCVSTPYGRRCGRGPWRIAATRVASSPEHAVTAALRASAYSASRRTPGKPLRQEHTAAVTGDHHRWTLGSTSRRNDRRVRDQPVSMQEIVVALRPQAANGAPGGQRRGNRRHIGVRAQSAIPRRELAHSPRDASGESACSETPAA